MGSAIYIYIYSPIFFSLCESLNFSSRLNKTTVKQNFRLVRPRRVVHVRATTVNDISIDTNFPLLCNAKLFKSKEANLELNYNKRKFVDLF